MQNNKKTAGIIQSLRGFSPQIDSSCFVAPNAVLVGDVVIGERSSVWYNVVIRGDVNSIRIGREVNVQDGTVIHGTYQEHGVVVHDRVTIGHLAMLHGCEIGRASLIGMSSIVMDGVQIGEYSIVGAGSLVTEGSKFPPRSLILGRPAKFKRELSQEEVDLLEQSADNYLLYSSWYMNEMEEKSEV
jgi:carbonic anhydrase/acetyltransferase-like protein (isoleucine patch superfamily)